MPRLERHDGIEAPLPPGAVMAADPEQRVLGSLPAAPLPGAPFPERPPPVPAVLHELLELRVRHRGRGDTERPYLDGMRPFLVVEDEGLVGCRPEGEGATRDSDVTRAVGRIQRRPGGPGINAGKARTRVAKGVQDEGEGLRAAGLIKSSGAVERRTLRACCGHALPRTH